VTLEAVRQALGRWPQPPAGLTVSGPGPHGRLIAAMRQALTDSNGVGSGDLMALTRQVLLHERLWQGGAPLLEVPTDHPWPHTREWSKIGVEAVATASGASLFDAQPWRPGWVQGDLSAVDLALAAPDGLRTQDRLVSSLARKLEPVPADPFLTDLASVSKYTTVGQREALRAAVAAPPGATVYAVLPTGTGKSLVGAIPGLLRPGTTTVVIVPTVALALDQERQFRERFGGKLSLPPQLAYVGGLDDDDKRAFRERLSDGRQPVVFASPEAVVNTLALYPSLIRLAGTGRLAYLVIDEAHLVSAWGDGFRSEFQQLPGVRRALLHEAMAAGHEAFRTILMTATLTYDTLQVLDALFGGETNLFVGSVFLRPEPRYLLAHCESSQQRMERLSQAVMYLPRPMVIYTTRRQDAVATVTELQGAGFRRVAAFHGDTPAKERERILDRWRGADGSPSLDAVVATSAFGLGVDLGDVRTVVHACIPESVDRYYQEVGRSGRDGHASIALLLPVLGQDERVAGQLSRRRLIGDEKGFGHWRGMIDRAERLGGGRFRLDTTVVPGHLENPSERNREWNFHTLTQMARAGLVQLEAETGRTDPDTVVVHVTEAGELRTPVQWRERTEVVRQRTQRFDRENLQAMISLARGEACWIKTFRDLYTFPGEARLRGGTPVAVIPTGRCMGCPHCQPATRAVPPETPPPIVPQPPPGSVDPPLEQALTRLLGGSDTLTVGVPSASQAAWQRMVLKVLRRCVANGVLRVVVPPQALKRSSLDDLHREARDRFVFVDSDLGVLPRFHLPTVVVHPPNGTGIYRAYYRLRTAPAPPRILVVPEDARDPERPHVPLRDMRMPWLSADRFLRSC